MRDGAAVLVSPTKLMENVLPAEKLPLLPFKAEKLERSTRMRSAEPELINDPPAAWITTLPGNAAPVTDATDAPVDVLSSATVSVPPTNEARNVMSWGAVNAE